jgi:asparaginyl-tRNA synthetase
MKVASEMIKSVIKYIMENCEDDLKFFNSFYDKELINRLTDVLGKDEFEKISYTKAIEILEQNNDNFEYKVSWGKDLQTEHEKYLTEKIFKAPVFVTDYPKEIKSFYMRQNADQKTVAAMDLLMPGIGELIGGSQREERLEVLENRMKELGMNMDDYSWYLDLRRYGSCKHSGFGVGFERLIMYLTGVSNIRDVLPFPKTCG